jgi:hypothetical protein
VPVNGRLNASLVNLRFWGFGRVEELRQFVMLEASSESVLPGHTFCLTLISFDLHSVGSDPCV